MNRFAKIAIVLGLVAAVGVVLVLKNNAASTAAKPANGAAGTGLPRLLDIGSVTCIPCKMMAPILEELRAEYAGAMQVDFIDVRQDPEAATAHGIRVIPTQIFFDASGAELFRHEGFIAKEDILAKWKELGIDLKPAADSPGE